MDAKRVDAVLTAHGVRLKHDLSLRDDSSDNNIYTHYTQHSYKSKPLHLGGEYPLAHWLQPAFVSRLKPLLDARYDRDQERPLERSWLRVRLSFEGVCVSYLPDIFEKHHFEMYYIFAFS